MLLGIQKAGHMQVTFSIAGHTAWLPCLDRDAMMRLHQVQVWVAPVLWRGIAWPPTASTATTTVSQVIAPMVVVPTMVIPAHRDRSFESRIHWMRNHCTHLKQEYTGS